jgi:hypothetical protein
MAAFTMNMSLATKAVKAPKVRARTVSCKAEGR